MTMPVATNAAAYAATYTASDAARACRASRSCSCLAAAVYVLRKDKICEAEREDERQNGGKFLNHFSSPSY